MSELEKLRERLKKDRPVPWESMPDFALYMDQVLNYMDRQVIRFEEGEALTSAMVNNYTKSGLVPRAAGKRYGREHLAYLTVICILKRVMSTRDMDLLIREELQGDRSIEDGYTAFCESLDQALNITAGEMESREHMAWADTLADAAIHFALLSYAAGVASERYVALLRQEREADRKAQARQEKVQERQEKVRQKEEKRQEKENRKQEKEEKRLEKEAARRQETDEQTDQDRQTEAGKPEEDASDAPVYADKEEGK